MPEGTPTRDDQVKKWYEDSMDTVFRNVRKHYYEDVVKEMHRRVEHAMYLIQIEIKDITGQPVASITKKGSRLMYSIIICYHHTKERFTFHPNKIFSDDQKYYEEIMNTVKTKLKSRPKFIDIVDYDNVNDVVVDDSVEIRRMSHELAKKYFNEDNDYKTILNKEKCFSILKDHPFHVYHVIVNPGYVV